MIYTNYDKERDCKRARKRLIDDIIHTDVSLSMYLLYPELYNHFGSCKAIVSNETSGYEAFQYNWNEVCLEMEPLTGLGKLYEALKL